MSSIIVATLAVAVIGMLIGILLVTVDKKFKVEVDEKQVAIRECLPGNNCGGCGYAGCDALASAIANQEAPVNACPAVILSQKRSAVCSAFRWKKQKKSPLMSNAPATAKMQQPDAVTSASTTALPLPAAGFPRGPATMAVSALAPVLPLVRSVQLPSIRVLQAWTVPNARPVENVLLPVRGT